MRRTLPTLALAAACFTLTTACGDQAEQRAKSEIGAPHDDEDLNDDEYDPDTLTRYRKALPARAQLEAKAPEGPDGMGLVLGETADAVQFVQEPVHGINGAVGGVLDMLEAVTATEPTLYDSEKGEFLWGPYDNDDSPVIGDTVAVWIVDNGEDAEEDFRYHYAFARGMGNDLASMVPVIFGGAEPDANNEDYGAGITLYDLEANRVFSDANGGLAQGQGRFVALYAKGEDENEAGTDVTWVVAAFRNFIGDDEAANGEAEAANFNHLFGHVDGADGTELDFVSIDALGDLHQNEDDADGEELEFLSIDVVAVNQGIGRGEILIAGGDLDDDNAPVNAGFSVECWDGAVARTYYDLNYLNGQVIVHDDEQSEGDISGCEGPFQATIEDLGIPTLDSIDQDLFAGLDALASNGLQAQDDTDAATGDE